MYTGHTEVELTAVSVFRAPAHFGADLTSYDPAIVDYFHLALMYGGDITLIFDPYIHLGIGAMPIYDDVSMWVGLEYSQPLQLGVKQLGRIQLTSHLVLTQSEGIGFQLFLRGYHDLHLNGLHAHLGIGFCWMDEYEIEF